MMSQQYNMTSQQYNMTSQQYHHDERTILENIVQSIWYFESVCNITEGHVTRNRPISIEYLHLTYNKDTYSEDHREYRDTYSEDHREYNDTCSEDHREYSDTCSEDHREYSDTCSDDNREYRDTCSDDNREYRDTCSDDNREYRYALCKLQTNNKRCMYVDLHNENQVQ